MRKNHFVYYTTKRTLNGYINLDRDFAAIFNGDRHAYDNSKEKYCTFRQYVVYSNDYESEHWTYNMIDIDVNDTIDNPESMYHTFSIPKKSGGYREICAPDEELKIKQIEILNALKRMCPYPHECAHAYTEGRSPKTAMEKHIKNNSHWYLKIDISGFFPSCTTDFVMERLDMVYPFYKLNKRSRELIKKYCFKDGALPQGAPTSPYLSNIVMIPFDYEFTDYLHNDNYVYTRYADDIIVSSYKKFEYQEIVDKVISMMCPQFKINEDKTRFGNAAGQNWNLGLMVTPTKITVGNQRKRRMKQSLYNYQKTKESWSLNDLQILLGELQYIISIEPDIYDVMYKPKFGDVRKEIIEQIKTL